MSQKQGFKLKAAKRLIQSSKLAALESASYGAEAIEEAIRDQPGACDQGTTEDSHVSPRLRNLAEPPAGMM